MYSEDFLENAFTGIINNKAEILNGEYCGCCNCLTVSRANEITEWILEPNGGEDTAACPNCTFDLVLSDKYPIHDTHFLQEMRNFHLG